MKIPWVSFEVRINFDGQDDISQFWWHDDNQKLDEQASIHENVSCVAILIHQIDLKSHVCVCSLKYERHMAHLGGTYVIKL